MQHSGALGVHYSALTCTKGLKARVQPLGMEVENWVRLACSEGMLDAVRRREARQEPGMLHHLYRSGSSRKRRLLIAPDFVPESIGKSVSSVVHCGATAHPLPCTGLHFWLR